MHVLQSQVAALINHTEHILDTSAGPSGEQWAEWLQDWAAAQVAPPVSVSVTGCMHHSAVRPELVTALFRMLETLVRQAPRYCTGITLQVQHAGSHLAGWIEVHCADPRQAARHPASQEAARYLLQYGGDWDVAPPDKTVWSCRFTLPCASDLMEISF
ncbi:MAG: hypothetical protein SF053_02640 [Bacteroidia bacterium]|nr:hypothetical protein [Bacteroidia bacterium]